MRSNGIFRWAGVVLVASGAACGGTGTGPATDTTREVSDTGTVNTAPAEEAKDDAGAASVDATMTTMKVDAGMTAAPVVDSAVPVPEANDSASPDVTAIFIPDASENHTPPKDAGAGGFSCNLILGVAATGEWFTQGGFEALMGGARWEAVTREHEYLEYWAQLATDQVSAGSAVRSDIWSVPPSPACAVGATTPGRVILVAYAETTNTKYNDYANVSDTTVRANWVSALEKIVTIIGQKYPSVSRIELMTMIRGPGTSGPGMDCNTATNTTHEDIVEPWVDDAIATVVSAHPSLVFAAPKFYIGSCNWFNGVGPHFIDAGHPELVAQEVATYYKANP